MEGYLNFETVRANGQSRYERWRTRGQVRGMPAAWSQLTGGLAATSTCVGLNPLSAIPCSDLVTTSDLVYGIYLQADGNFKLDSLSSATRRGDSASFLKNGGHWVNEEKAKAYLAAPGHESEDRDQVRNKFPYRTFNYPDELKTQRGTCNTKAGNDAHATQDSDKDANGLLAVSCDHTVIQPNGVVDLKKGEK